MKTEWYEEVCEVCGEIFNVYNEEDICPHKEIQLTEAQKLYREEENRFHSAQYSDEGIFCFGYSAGEEKNKDVIKKSTNILNVSWEKLETFLGTYADTIPNEAYDDIVEIQNTIKYFLMSEKENTKAGDVLK